jgi:hypothetical protein
MERTKLWSSGNGHFCPGGVSEDTFSNIENPVIGGRITRIPCAVYRGGTSKPVFFLEDDLPKDAKKRDAVVLDRSAPWMSGKSPVLEEQIGYRAIGLDWQ